jgi:hypothetical protein
MSEDGGGGDCYHCRHKQILAIESQCTQDRIMKHIRRAAEDHKLGERFEKRLGRALLAEVRDVCRRTADAEEEAERCRNALSVRLKGLVQRPAPPATKELDFGADAAAKKLEALRTELNKEVLRRREIEESTDRHVQKLRIELTENMRREHDAALKRMAESHAAERANDRARHEALLAAAEKRARSMNEVKNMNAVVREAELEAALRTANAELRALRGELRSAQGTLHSLALSQTEPFAACSSTTSSLTAPTPTEETWRHEAQQEMALGDFYSALTSPLGTKSSSTF